MSIPTSAEPASDLFASALHYLNAGQAALAEAPLRRLLQWQPQHVEALHLLGVCLHQLGRHGEAEAAFGSVLKAAPGHAAAWANLGNALRAQERIAESLAAFERACACNPALEAVQRLRALALIELQRPVEALAVLDALFSRGAGSAPAHTLRGYALQQLERHEEALEAYSLAIGAEPSDLGAAMNRAALLRHLGRMAEARTAFSAALALDPGNVDAYAGRASAAAAAGAHGEALADLLRALALAPQRSDLRLAAAASLIELRQPAAALEQLEPCLRLESGLDQARFLQGTALLQLERHGAALDALEDYVRLRPQDARAWNQIGLARKGLDQLEEALQALEEAVRLDPQFDMALANLGNTLYRLGRPLAAQTAYEQALRIRPGNEFTRWNLALCRLQLGDWPGAWPDYEARWAQTHLALFAPRPFFARPRWRGDAGPRGQALFLHAEQGLGDTLQFCRYAVDLAMRGARVVMEVPPPLRRLLERSLGETMTIIARGEPIPPFDAHSPLMSLPGAFRTTLASVPAPVPYLQPSAAHRRAWAERLGVPDRPRIGLAWSSGRSDPRRDLPLAVLAPLADGPWDLLALQPEVRDGDRGALALFKRLRCFGNELADFEDTAALVSLCDLVISVDTAVAHLAGALGAPVWILLPTAADWRWLTDRCDSPWYPTARLFRQSRRGQWNDVVEAVKRELHESPEAPLSRLRARGRG